MISSNLIFLILFFSLILVVLVFFYIKSTKKKNKQNKVKNITRPETTVRASIPTFAELKAIIKDKATSVSELEKAVNDLMKYYGEIPAKRGISTDKMFDEYAGLLIAVCRHANTNAKIVLQFDKALREKNPSYVNNIEEMLTKGLNSRS